MPEYKKPHEILDMYANVKIVKRLDLMELLLKSPPATKAELETLEVLEFSEICGPKKRFPNDGTYLNLTFGFYADALSVLSSLDADEPRYRRQLRCIVQHAMVPDNESSCDTFDRARFERKYNLRWSGGIRWKRIILLSAAFVLVASMLANA